MQNGRVAGLSLGRGEALAGSAVAGCGARVGSSPAVLAGPAAAAFSLWELCSAVRNWVILHVGSTKCADYG